MIFFGWIINNERKAYLSYRIPLGIIILLLGGIIIIVVIYFLLSQFWPTTIQNADGHNVDDDDESLFAVLHAYHLAHYIILVDSPW